MTTIHYQEGGLSVRIEVSDEVAEFLRRSDRRQALDERRETRRHSSFERLSEIGFPFAGSASAESEFLRRDTAETYRNLFESLTKRQQAVSAKFFWEGKSKAQIAREIGVSEKVVRAHLDRSQKKLVRDLALV